jgi:hypothetical protein
MDDHRFAFHQVIEYLYLQAVALADLDWSGPGLTILHDER